MSREVRRVPLAFDWPLEEVWEGYLMPDRLDEVTCQECGGKGQTTARLWLIASAQMILMLAEDLRDQQLGRPMHTYFAEFYTTSYGTRPSEDIAEVAAGLADGPVGTFGYCSSDGWRAARKIITAAGLDPDVWGVCRACGGHGATEAYPGQRAEAAAWEPVDPPAGEGWQAWETTSEGSPISPVFPDAEGLIDWCTRSPRIGFGGRGSLTREQAEAFVAAGHSIGTFVVQAGRVIDGAAAVAELGGDS